MASQLGGIALGASGSYPASRLATVSAVFEYNLLTMRWPRIQPWEQQLDPLCDSRSDLYSRYSSPEPLTDTHVALLISQLNPVYIPTIATYLVAIKTPNTSPIAALQGGRSADEMVGLPPIPWPPTRT
ncbi:hypothetical protein TWF481_011543 [Arthrobotrys musiformis]|uniref:Uncharacterized protein n=1 Tax=Arthrobotrys musiformis TaxID=47236 RepID=A0AAV9VZS2_9PEZI